MQYKNYDFSLWCDFVERDFIKNQFLKLLDSKVINGATSNPSIFADAINNSDAYKEQKLSLQNDGKSNYEALALEDIKEASKALLPLYERGDDGFISIEVDPALSDDSFGTISEGVRLYESIGMPNVMIKVPATKAGYVAMRELSSHGININATLVFSPMQAKECYDAINEGMSKSDMQTKAVISVFVSRFDRKVDDKLPKSLQSKLGIFNAMKCYNEIQNNKNPHIKTLFASTGVKGDNLKPYYYIKELLLPHSVNTAPLKTIKSFIDNDDFVQSKLMSHDEISLFFKSIHEEGINMQSLYDELLEEGLEAFKIAFADMISKL